MRSVCLSHPAYLTSLAQTEYSGSPQLCLSHRTCLLQPLRSVSQPCPCPVLPSSSPEAPALIRDTVPPGTDFQQPPCTMPLSPAPPVTILHLQDRDGFLETKSTSNRVAWDPACRESSTQGKGKRRCPHRTLCYICQTHELGSSCKIFPVGYKVPIFSEPQFPHLENRHK